MQQDNTAAAQAEDFTTAATVEETQTSATDTAETAENVDATVTDQQTTAEAVTQPAEEEEEEITYHAVQKDGSVTAIWEMQGRKHHRTIDPRSREGAEILRLFTEEEGEEQQAA